MIHDLMCTVHTRHVLCKLTWITCKHSEKLSWSTEVAMAWRTRTLKIAVCLNALAFALVSAVADNMPGDDTSPQVKLQKVPVGRKPKISVAMYSVLSLVILYFLVLTFEMFNKNMIFSPFAKLIYGKRSKEELDRERAINNALKEQISQIPMFCVLILFSRLRAKVDLENTEPPGYAKQAYVIAAVVIYLQVLVASVLTKKLAIYICVVVVTILLKVVSIVNVITIFYSIFNLKKMHSEF